MSLAGLARVAWTQGRPAEAARLLGTVEAILDAMGVPPEHHRRRQLARGAAPLRAALGEDVFAAAWAASRALTLDQVVARWLQADEERDSGTARPEVPIIAPAKLPDGLSPREVEVLRLIAAGKRDREIAEALFISRNTVIRHVSHIFDKIGATNRTEAALYATRHGLAE